MSNMMKSPTYLALDQEIMRARTKFPGNRFLLAALVEEVGELAEAIAAGDKSAIYREAIQCACVAVRIAEEGDATTYQTFTSLPGVIGLVVRVGHVARFFLQQQPDKAKLASKEVEEFGGWIHRFGDKTFSDITDEEAKP
jgi:NTP pyrophosphatase (non-canonical NTP hydrolase)